MAFGKLGLRLGFTTFGGSVVSESSGLDFQYADNSQYYLMVF